jgi:thioredoxin reductase (NADPH)
MDYELAIIGAGPAGYTAGIYAVRAGINTILFDKKGGGGLTMLSPNIENYPGFESIPGADLAEKMRQHASKYTEMKFVEEVKKIEKKDDVFQINTTEKIYTVKAVLLSMGTEYRKLNVPGEKELAGKGVSYCATCDGFFFKDKKVAVIGGGNSAVIESIYLKQIGVKDVTIIHRRDQLRAEKAYQEEALTKKVNIIYDTNVEKINGSNIIESIDTVHIKTHKKSIIKIDGVFISIGEEPQNDIAKALGVKVDDKGYIIVDKKQRTNIKGVYAAGDITGGLRQVVTACAEGAIAALTSTEVLGKQYPY